MELAREYIIKAQDSCQRALNDLDKKDIRKTLGDLDFVEDRIRAAKILLRIQLKEGEENETDQKND